MSIGKMKKMAINLSLSAEKREGTNITHEMVCNYFTEFSTIQSLFLHSFQISLFLLPISKKIIHCYSVKHISGPVPFSGDMKLMTMKMTRLRRTKTDFLLLFHNKNICLISFIESKCSQHLFIAHIFNIWSSRPVT